MYRVYWYPIFAIFYQNQLHDASVSSDQNTLTIDTIYFLDFEIPLYEIQERTMNWISPMLLKMKKINHLLLGIDS
jgi:hypothetical protein